MLPAKADELKNAFFSHLDVINMGDNNLKYIQRKSYMLLKFYAVECGLKAYILKKDFINKRHSNRYIYMTTEAFGEIDEYKFLKEDGHNINRILNKIGLHKMYISENIHFTVLGKKQQCNCKDIHQAWRYGISFIDKSEELEAENKLQEIILWLEKNLR